MATGNYFRLLGTQPYRGRFFAEADDSPTSPPVAVISYAFWQRELGAQPDAVGRIVRINSVGATIVGVARREFQGERIGAPVDVWLPLSHAGQLSSPASLTASSIWLQPMARLRADVPVARAEAELSLLWDQLKTLSIQFRGVKKYHLALLPLGRRMRKRRNVVRPAFGRLCAGEVGERDGFVTAERVENAGHPRKLGQLG